MEPSSILSVTLAELTGKLETPTIVPEILFCAEAEKLAANNKINW